MDLFKNTKQKFNLFIIFGLMIIFNESLRADDLADMLKAHTALKNGLNVTKSVSGPCGGACPLDDSRFFISDSLVKNLSCKALTKENVLTQLQDNAFSADKHIPLTNWPANNLEQCWGLSLTQRRLFYLARFKNVISGSLSSEAKNKIMDLTKKRGSSGVFDIDSPNLADLDAIQKQQGSTREPASYGAVVDSLLAPEGDKNFKTEIEARQKDRFFSFDNLSLLKGDREREEGENNQTFNDLQKSLSQGRMPLIVLRHSKTEQHAVLVKKMTLLKTGEYQLFLYDSNNPAKTQTIYYQDNQFYFNPTPTTKRLMGVFIKDEDDMDDIQLAVYKYYKSKCDLIN